MRGDKRENASRLIENGEQLYPGNPLRITFQDDFIVLFIKQQTGVTSNYIDENLQEKTKFTNWTGDFKLTYTAKGLIHPFWKKPFLREPDAFYYLFLVGLGLFLLLIPCSLIYCCIVRPCCLKKPICCCSKTKAEKDGTDLEKESDQNNQTNQKAKNKVNPAMAAIELNERNQGGAGGYDADIDRSGKALVVG